MKPTVFAVFAIGLSFLIVKTDAAVTFTAQPTTATVDNNAASGSTVDTVIGVADNGIITHVIDSVTNSGITYFAIDGTTGAITVAAAGVSPLSIAAAADEYAITVSAQDDDATPVTHVITVSVNLPPAIAFSPYTFTVNDGSTANDIVGTIDVTDPDSDGMTYTLTGTGNGDFSVANKYITVVNTLDRSSTSSYTLEAEVSDGRLTATAAVTILVDVASNNAPVFTSTTYTITATNGATAGATVGSVTITDADGGDTHTFAIISGNTNSDFDINTNAKVGTIVVAATKTLDKATTASYVLEVTASDGTDTKTATVTISFSGASTLVPMLLMIVLCWLFVNV